MAPPNAAQLQQLKRTEGAHNSNASFTRVTGVTAFNAFVEVGMTVQQENRLLVEQGQRFVKCFEGRFLPPADAGLKPLTNPKATHLKQFAICFHQNFEYTTAV
jgi:hypothetical protein